MPSPTGAITGYIDVAQVALYAFWAFFFGLILYLRREDRREGYPLTSARPDNMRTGTYSGVPAPKVFLLSHGGPQTTERKERDVAATATAGWEGAPLQPTGNPMADGVGPAAYADREDTVDFTYDEHLPKIVPLRAAPGFSIEPRDPDPRGMPVIGGDRQVAGTVRDVWVDRSELIIRYLEVEVATSVGPRNVLVPMPMATVSRKPPQVKVSAILAHQFADVPKLQNPSQVTLREEDRISAYYGGGQLYATPGRLGPAL